MNVANPSLKTSVSPDSVPLSSIPELKDLESQGITTIVQPGPSQERYTFNMDHSQVPLFADRELRRALVLSVDRQTIVDKLLFGLTKIARGDWDNTPWESSAIGPDPYDPTQARRILDGLGWTPGADGIARWGDYSAATADENGNIWIATEFIPAKSSGIPGTGTFFAHWGTFVARVAGED